MVGTESRSLRFEETFSNFSTQLNIMSSTANLLGEASKVAADKSSAIHLTRRVRQRRGTIVVLAAIVITSLIIVGGVAINLTQLATARTEIRLASDAAAKAGAVVLGQTQDPTQARAAARSIAARHEVATMSMHISDIDVQFGNSAKSQSGEFNFQVNQTQQQRQI